jgi:CDP-diacylglycerol--serine O-phosphatidyltransferase
MAQAPTPDEAKPARRRPRKPRAELPLISLLPNALTLGAICAGLTAIRMAAFGGISLAVALIILAAILDGVDGRVARALGSQSNIGAELDSLADFVNFGVAPAMVLYFWALKDAHELGWAAALIYALCCCLRLARFNVGMKGDTPPDKRFFTGVPSPAGALVALAPLFLSRVLPGHITLPAPFVAGWLVVSGGLMVSRLPTFSMKTTIYAEHAWAALVAVVAGVTLLTVYPWEMLLAFDVIYLVSIVWSVRTARRPEPPPTDAT